MELEDSMSVLDQEGDETLAAMDEGIRDADAGRTVPLGEVRKLLFRRPSRPRWFGCSI